MKPLTAAQRTVSMFEGSTWGLEQNNYAAPIVEPGPIVERVALSPRLENAPCWHLRFERAEQMLCGLRLASASTPRENGSLGTCLECRSEASRLRARVGR